MLIVYLPIFARSSLPLGALAKLRGDLSPAVCHLLLLQVVAVGVHVIEFGDVVGS